MLQYFDIMLAEFSKRWHCRRLHGSDQAIHNYLLYTGKLVGSGEFCLAQGCACAEAASMLCAQLQTALEIWLLSRWPAASLAL